MSINDELDEGAADLRDVQTEPTTGQEAQNSAASAGAEKRSVSLPEVMLAIGILLGALAIVYVLLQMKNSASPAAPPYPLSPSTRPNSQNSPH